MHILFKVIVKFERRILAGTKKCFNFLFEIISFPDQLF